MNNILIIGMSAITFEREIVRNNKELIEGIGIFAIGLLVIVLSELFYLLTEPQYIIPEAKPQITVPTIVEESEDTVGFSVENFLHMQPAIDTIHTSYNNNYHIFEITLTDGYEQLEQISMRNYINELSFKIYLKTKERIMIAVVNEYDTEQYIYCAVDGTMDYFVEPIHWNRTNSRR